MNIYSNPTSNFVSCKATKPNLNKAKPFVEKEIALLDGTLANFRYNDKSYSVIVHNGNKIYGGIQQSKPTGLNMLDYLKVHDFFHWNTIEGLDFLKEFLTAIFK